MAELLLHASGFVSRCSPSGSWNNTRERKGREKIKKGGFGGGREAIGSGELLYYLWGNGMDDR